MSFSASKNFKICFLQNKQTNAQEDKPPCRRLPFANPAFPVWRHPAALPEASTRAELRVQVPSEVPDRDCQKWPRRGYGGGQSGCRGYAFFL